MCIRDRVASDLATSPPSDDAGAISWSRARGYGLQLVSVITEDVLADPMELLTARVGAAATNGGTGALEHPAAWASAQAFETSAAGHAALADWIEVEVDDAQPAMLPQGSSYASTYPYYASPYDSTYASTYSSSPYTSSFATMQAGGEGTSAESVSIGAAAASSTADEQNMSVDQIFDAEHSEYEAVGSGWSASDQTSREGVTAYKLAAEC